MANIMKKVFLSRAVDNLNFDSVTKEAGIISRKLDAIGYTVINSYYPLDVIDDSEVCKVVDSEIAMISNCDILVADLSIPNHPYIGCIGEIIYAYQFHKPIYVIVGNSNNDKRLWLKYHATAFFKSIDDLIHFLYVQ